MKLEFDSEKGKAFSLHKCKGVIFEKVTVNGCKVSDINLELVYPIIYEDSVEPVPAKKHILLHKDPLTSKPGDLTFNLRVDGNPQQTDIPDNIGDAELICVTTTPFKFSLELKLL